jgi:predicted metalloenzyme YecM
MKYRVNQNNPKERFYRQHGSVGDVLSIGNVNGHLLATFQYRTLKPKPSTIKIPLDLLEPYQGD